MDDRLERLTNLLALLLETPQPLSLVQIANELDGQYAADERNRRAQFERDKAALRSIGVPIETTMVDGGTHAGQTRYRIDRAAYELADLDLDAAEMRALQLAVAAVHTGSSAGDEAIRKLGGSPIGTPVAVSAVVPDRAELPELRVAIAQRSTIEFGYRGATRRVDPWGLLLRGGFWYVVGFDHDRQAKRTFRVDRLDQRRPMFTLGEAGAYDRPDDFDPRDAFPADPKRIGHAADDDVDALVHIDRPRASGVVGELGDHRVEQRNDDGSVVVRVPAANRDAFLSWVLGLAQHAEVLGPPDLRAAVIDALDAVIAAGASGR